MLTVQNNYELVKEIINKELVLLQRHLPQTKKKICAYQKMSLGISQMYPESWSLKEGDLSCTT